MIGRRTAASLCVLLGHAFIAFLLLTFELGPVRRQPAAEFVSEPITLFLEPLDEPDQLPPSPAAAAHKPPPEPAAAPTQSAAESPANPGPPDTRGVDWPIEGQKAVTRLLAREAEAARIAKMFAGPGGTWVSLTKRQREKLSKFRWKPGVDGLEYDEKGNAIFHLPNGCTLVNLSYFACALGAETIHGDLFENMRQYFDEQRLPETNEGNGTEPEALRPAN
jgi:hypothetical protein